ncbi:hypothetical protein NQD34_009110 [Periophthalmus magnuspinnatus]|nr:hypothetical protein NQD34_009110 [Periophthalmus magnuspinnatus]
MERRIDLASLFCMIARHGPAVLLTLVGIGCVVAGFVIFKNMREKRRRRRASEADRRDTNAGYGDAAVGLGEKEEPRVEGIRRGSTDASDESSPDDVKEHGYLSQVRQRRTASERKSYKHKEPGRDTAIEKAQHTFFWEWNSHRTQSYAEEAVQKLEKGNTHKSAEDATQEVHGTRETQLNDLGCEEEKMPEADSSEDITTTNEDVSEEEFRQEETVLFTFNSQTCSYPTPNLSVNDSKENTKETNSKHLESALENAPVLMTEQISSALYKEDKDNIVDQANGTNDQSRGMNNERQADKCCDDEGISTPSPVEVKEGLLLAPSQKGEPSKFDQTRDDVIVKPSDSTNFALNGQQSDTSLSPISNAQIDQMIALEGNSHSEVQTDKDFSTSQKDNKKEFPDTVPSERIDASLVDTIPQSLDVSVKEDSSLVNQETSKMVETETVILSENKSLQDQQHREIAPQVLDGNQPYTDILSDQKDTTGEQQIQPICQETNLNVDQREVQSSSVNSNKVECLVQSQPSPNQLTEVFDKETSLSSLPADVKTEIQSLTDTTEPSIDLKGHGLTEILDTETTIMDSGLNNESKPAGQSASTDTNEISTAMISNKVECIVEQIVADAIKEVRQTSLEHRPAQLEEKSLEQPSQVQKAQHSVSINNENVASNATEKDSYKVFKEESKEVVFCSNMAAQITEEVVNTVCSLELSKKDIVTSNASDSFSQIYHDNNDMPTVKTALQEIRHVEEERVDQQTLESVENEVSKPLGETNVIQQAVIEVNSVKIEENVSLEQLGVQPLPDNKIIDRDNLAKEPKAKAVERDNNGEVDCSNMATQMQVEKVNTVASVEVNDLTNVEGEVLTEIKMETVENLEKIQQKVPEMVADINSELSKSVCEVENVLPAKEENQPEITPVIETEILGNTATSNEVHSDQKDLRIPTDPNNQVSNLTEKNGCKVVIICRTLEGSTSAVEMSDDEDVDSETSHIRSKSIGFSTCQDHLANEEATVGIVANALIEETTSQDASKNSDLTAALDFSQASAIKPMEQIKLKDDAVSSPSLESGISSMAVSPEMEEGSKEIGQIVEFEPMLSSQGATCTVFHAEEKVSHNLFTSDGVATVTKEDVATMVIGDLTSSPVLLSEPEDISNESLVINEDSFGSEIEDGYQKEMEAIMMQVVKSFSDDMTKEVAKKVEVKKEQACAASKEEGEKLDSEKTEISIMEATMDHNEWIIDGSYQVLPWMNLTSSRDASSSKEGVELVESKLSAQTSTTEDGAENAKKVLAVQPMPQNVNVTFRVHYLPLSPYQTVAVTGDQQELGAWKSVVPLEKTKDGYWSCVVGLPAESHVEWKFVVLDKGEVCRWEECGNRLLYTGYGDDLLVHKWWGFL